MGCCVQASFSVALARILVKEDSDFNVYSAKKRKEKLAYMHQNPVTRKLVKYPKNWIWSSYASYSGRGAELICIDFVD